MELGVALAIFLSSLITSYTFLGTMVVSILKDLGDNGYILKDGYNIIDLISSDKDIDSIEVNKLLMLIPIINLLYSLCLFYQYLENKDELFDDVSAFNSIRKMTYEEELDYRNNPSLLSLLEKNKNKESDLQINDTDKELSFLDKKNYDLIQKKLNENTDTSSYYAISNSLFKMKACVSIKDFSLDGEEAEKYCKMLVDSMYDQLGENDYIKLDIGYFFKDSIDCKNKYEELYGHIIGLYESYKYLEKAHIDVSEQILSFTKDKAIFVSIKSGDNYKSFILNYDMFKEELKRHCLTATGIEDLSYEEFIMHLINEKVLSLPVAVSRQKITYSYQDSYFDNNKNEGEDDKPKVMVKKTNKKTNKD